MALPRANRLKLRRDFDLVYQRGTRRRGKHLTIRLVRQKLPIADRRNQPTPSESPPLRNIVQPVTRIGISISQKVHKRAVVRNRIKRQLRAICRRLLPRLAQGWDLVITVHPQALQCDYQQFLQELEQLLTDAEVLDGYS
ncbi:ribonuclease P protein component [Pantanalinema sp. GBBB05]|uniref:ribonuclease P protein component n=1 Tax=Pantanalinema sp. GBBB05 TaxID=2604139 RepID=UPI001D23C93A|nr:ribonuclease P protein component [Pantanalinema sp. GBBB05]